MVTLSRKDALHIFQSLKEGTPPPTRLIEHIHVGRERWLEGMKWYLDSAKDADISAVRFIVGDYGSGKTHFLRMTANMALKSKFVTCEITLSQETRLDRFDSVWREIMSKMATPESEGEPVGIVHILNRLCSSDEEELQKMLNAIDSITNLDPDFREAIKGYLYAKFKGQNWNIYLQWLKGDSIRPYGIGTRIDRNSARAMLRSLMMFLKHIGYSGMVLFLDELELLLDQSSRIRSTGYDILRQFVEDAGKIPSFLLNASATPQMLEEPERGFPSYAALWQRIGGLFAEASGDYRAITIRLDSVEFTDKNLFEMIQKLYKIHAIAMGWDPTEYFTGEWSEKIINIAKKLSHQFPTPRFLVELVIRLLEIKHQNREKALDEIFNSAVNAAENSILNSERSRHREWE
ncbi:MAG: BREX system ATP-binding domain-containing protein [Promethearchaeota archaeon]